MVRTVDRLILLVALMSLLQSIKCTVSRCPSGYTDEFGNACYSFNSTPQKHSDAVRRCSSNNGALLDVKNEAERDFIVTSMVKKRWKDAWLAGTVTLGDWHWEQGDYGVIAAQGCYKDTNRGRDLKYQVSGNNPNVGTCIKQCNGANKDYKYAGVQYGYQCFCDDTYGRYGIGNGCTMPCKDKPDEICGGSNHNYIYKLNGMYSSWVKGRPNVARFDNTCASLVSADYDWRETNCIEHYRYVCQFSDQSACVDGQHEFEGRCYSVGEAKTWFKSREACANAGGSLLVIPSESDQQTIRRFIKTVIKPHSTDQFWIDASSVYWRNGDKSSLVYTDWFSKQPSKIFDGIPSKKKCIQMVYGEGSTIRWLVTDCESHYIRYICKKVLPPTTTSSTTTTQTPSTLTSTTSLSTAAPSSEYTTSYSKSTTTTESTSTLTSTTSLSTAAPSSEYVTSYSKSTSANVTAIVPSTESKTSSVTGINMASHRVDPFPYALVIGSIIGGVALIIVIAIISITVAYKRKRDVVRRKRLIEDDVNRESDCPSVNYVCDNPLYVPINDQQPNVTINWNNHQSPSNGIESQIGFSNDVYEEMTTSET
ncbi:uncharacterized protein LOC141906951 [Tubulanus polymorphus]|uniref:uncharacterized protein LOC141906951 n=1 Tax=Tubulanus polymorphus TaxID=672921 RepID=UPI003DA3943E